MSGIFIFASAANAPTTWFPALTGTSTPRSLNVLTDSPRTDVRAISGPPGVASSRKRTAAPVGIRPLTNGFWKSSMKKTGTAWKTLKRSPLAARSSTVTRS